MATLLLRGDSLRCCAPDPRLSLRRGIDLPPLWASFATKFFHTIAEDWSYWRERAVTRAARDGVVCQFASAQELPGNPQAVECN